MVLIAITLFLQKTSSYPANKDKSTSATIKPNYSYFQTKPPMPMTFTPERAMINLTLCLQACHQLGVEGEQMLQ